MSDSCPWRDIRIVMSDFNGFAEALSDRFAVLDLTDSIVLCDTFKNEVLNASEESIGERTRAMQNFISQETQEATRSLSRGSSDRR